MRTFTLALLAIAVLAPSANGQTEELNWWLDWVKSRTMMPAEPVPDWQIRSPQVLPAKFNQPRRDLEQLQRQYAPHGERNQTNAIPVTVIPVSSQPPQTRQGLQTNGYIESISSPPNLPIRTEVEFIPRSALPAPLRTRYPGETTPTVKETESRIVRRLCTEYKRGLTPGELDELARNLVEKNRLYLSGEGKSPYGYAIEARNTKKC
ncbi:hypothetical protein IQ218_17370 [Synechocystis salina LEGE 06099]|uniref:hypothetical protein n=1 Tax=Synechocystis salina TaxID=945780 RepID=UPI00187ED641|nr:hypothetical protein [Synechocystis salina]MBE9204876.1 hypothetical protein [Synechocystis salina LEGE 06099]